jgi:phosphatidate cytidylyltransferase
VLRAWIARWIGIVAVGTLPALPWIAPGGWPEAALAVVAGTSMATWISLLLLGPRADAPAFAGHAIAGFVFVSTGLTSLAVLRMHQDGFAWATTVLIVVWANDTGAFLGGKLLGSHKLIPSVSPGKTREGLAVGAIAGLAGALDAHVGFAAIAREDAIVLALIAAVLGPMGDLCKSMMKRAAGVKDAGKLLLAHGGMLDRIDAVLFVAPPVLAYLELVRG